MADGVDCVSSNNVKKSENISAKNYITPIKILVG